MTLMAEYIIADLSLIPRPCCVPPTWPGYETTSGFIGHTFFTCFISCVCLFLQSMQLIESGCRLAPPPGCHRALYRLMIHCWWVHGVSMGAWSMGCEHGGMKYGVWGMGYNVLYEWCNKISYWFFKLCKVGKKTRHGNPSRIWTSILWIDCAQNYKLRPWGCLSELVLTVVHFHLMQALRSWETSDVLRYCQNVVTLRLAPAKLDWSRQKGASPGILPWSTAWGWREPVPWPTRVLYRW